MTAPLGTSPPALASPDATVTPPADTSSSSPTSTPSASMHPAEQTMRDFATQGTELLQRATQLNNIKVTGFMTMAPYFDESEMARPYFKQLKDYRDNTVISFPDAKELSMGMSEDFEIAVEEGSTLVRIGTAIFGPRN